MKVLAINGSPRKNGNTAQLLQEALAPLQAAGWQTELVQLGGKKIQGCRGCGKCAELKNGRCVFDNDLLNELLQKMLAADAMILGTPCYFTDMSAELKALVDRAGYVAYVNGGLFQGKIGGRLKASRRFCRVQSLYGSPRGRSFCAYKRKQNRAKGNQAFPFANPLDA